MRIFVAGHKGMVGSALVQSLRKIVTLKYLLNLDLDWTYWIWLQ